MPQAPGSRIPPVAIGAQPARLVEVDDGSLPAGAAPEPDARKRELALLRLPVGDQGPRIRLR